MTNKEFVAVADKFNALPLAETVGELLEQLSILPKETRVIFSYQEIEVVPRVFGPAVLYF